MRLVRCGAFLIIAACLVGLLSGCGNSVSIADILKQKGISSKTVSGFTVELRYLAESKGSNYKYADITGNAPLLNVVLDGIASSKQAKKPSDKQYSPELMSDCELVFIDATGNFVSFYYVIQNNLLIFPESKKSKNEETLQYLYFSSDGRLTSLIQEQQQLAKLKQTVVAKPFRNMEELKSSIAPDELAEEGTEINFEFFNDQTPENSGTACSIYTSKEFSAVPQDSYLITAYSKSKTGQQEKLSILGMEANTNYTKITVAEPDNALDSVDTGNSVPDSYAITVKKEAIDSGKWIVFVDSNNNIFDVILPEDIGSISSASAQPLESPAPSGTMTASPSPGAQASASPAATDPFQGPDGPGDEQ